MAEELIIEQDEILTVEKPDEDLDTTPEKEFTPKKSCPFCGRTDFEWI